MPSKIVFNLMKLIQIFSFKVIILLIFILNDNNNVIFAQDVKQTLTSPKDYSYSTTKTSTRVRELVNFFDNLKDSSSYDPEIREKQSVIISLPEAASKLYILVNGYPISVKCDKYVNLINKPNIRTYSMINELVYDEKSFDQIQQNDANLISKLTDARSFDALAKLQTIIQTIESEREFSKSRKSLFEPIVQKELLNCINYFVYKHQLATTGLIDYVRDYNLTNQSSAELELNLKKFYQIIDQMKQLEKDIEGYGDNKNSSIIIWLECFIRMQQLSIENNYELPKLIVDFITEPKRLERLKTLSEIFDDVEKLKKDIQQFESNLSGSNLRNNDQYRNSLLKLAKLMDSYKELLSNETFLFIHKPMRWLLIETLRNHAVDEQNSIEAEIPTTSHNEESGIASIKEVDEEETSQQQQDESSLTEDLLEYSDPIPPPATPVEAPQIKPLASNIATISGSINQVQKETDDSAATCPNMSHQLSNDLRSFYYIYSTIKGDNIGDNTSYIKNLIKRLYSYVTVCQAKDSNHNFDKQSNWPFFSLTKKVATWITTTVQKYKQLNSQIINILDLVDKSRFNNYALLTNT